MVMVNVDLYSASSQKSLMRCLYAIYVYKTSKNVLQHWLQTKKNRKNV